MRRDILRRDSGRSWPIWNEPFNISLKFVCLSIGFRLSFQEGKKDHRTSSPLLSQRLLTKIRDNQFFSFLKVIAHLILLSLLFIKQISLALILFGKTFLTALFLSREHFFSFFTEDLRNQSKYFAIDFFWQEKTFDFVLSYFGQDQFEFIC